VLLGQVPGVFAILGIGFVVTAGIGAERTGGREAAPSNTSAPLLQHPGRTGVDHQTDLADKSDGAVFTGASRD
jgi:hypothetical protein